MAGFEGGEATDPAGNGRQPSKKGAADPRLEIG
jgi:hypothetical protein